jgi:hypothetical protein
MPFTASDDQQYLTWIREHPSGYVLNSTRPPTASYLMLHRASCHTVSGKPTRGDSWTRFYSKICSPDRAELEAWAKATLGGRVKPCRFCAP